MRAQSGEVCEGPRKLRTEPAMQDWLESFLFEFAGPCALVEKQTQFGSEADVRKRDVIAHQILTIRRQSLVDSRGVFGEPVTRP